MQSIVIIKCILFIIYRPIIFIRRNIIFCFVLLVLLANNINIVLYNKNRWNKIIPPEKHTHISRFKPNISNDLSCHDIEIHESLPIADYETFPEKSIFFHETSCKGGLDAQQACAVESAARNNPGWQVNVLFCGPVNKDNLEKGSALAKLLELNNVKIARIHVAEYARGTPAEAFLAGNSAINKSKFRVNNVANILRLLTLYKHGGIYMDLDVFTVKSFDSLPKNWVGKESDLWLGSAVIAMAKDEVGRNFTETAIREFQERFQPDIWAYNGPYLIIQVLGKLCSVKNVTAMSADVCNGIGVYHQKYFYPLPYSHWRYYYYAEGMSYFLQDTVKENLTYAYTHHLWNRLSQVTEIMNGSFVQSLAKEYCPSIFEMYSDEFSAEHRDDIFE